MSVLRPRIVARSHPSGQATLIVGFMATYSPIGRWLELRSTILDPLLTRTGDVDIARAQLATATTHQHRWPWIGVADPPCHVSHSTDSSLVGSLKSRCCWYPTGSRTDELGRSPASSIRRARLPACSGQSTRGASATARSSRRAKVVSEPASRTTGTAICWAGPPLPTAGSTSR